MKDLRERVAVVTGAGSGIGRSTALRLAGEGCHVALADIDESGTEETARRVREKGVRATVHRVDVSDRSQVAGLADAVVEMHGQVNIVVNNAGYGYFDTIEDGSCDEFERLFSVNFWGVVYGTKAFLPHLRRSGDGHIVNVSSLGGMSTVPYFGAYCSSKFAVRGFTETLAQELQGSGIGVTCVHPGGVKTPMARNSPPVGLSGTERDRVAELAESWMVTSPDYVARKIVGAIRNRRVRLVVGIDAQISYHAMRLFPTALIQVVGLLNRHSRLGRTFEARSASRAGSVAFRRKGGRNRAAVG